VPAVAHARQPVPVYCLGSAAQSGSANSRCSPHPPWPSTHGRTSIGSARQPPPPRTVPSLACRYRCSSLAGDAATGGYALSWQHCPTPKDNTARAHRPIDCHAQVRPLQLGSQTPTGNAFNTMLPPHHDVASGGWARILPRHHHALLRGPTNALRVILAVCQPPQGSQSGNEEVLAAAHGHELWQSLEAPADGLLRDREDPHPIVGSN
jgi:hypothetical protein